MKKTAVLCLLLCLLALFGCKNNTQSAENTTADAETTQKTAIRQDSLNLKELPPEKALVVYFSENDCIKQAAEYISQKTGAALCRIETELPYPENSAEFERRIKEEKEKNILPAIKNRPQRLGDYSVIFFGFPVWEDSLPMAALTFLSDYDMRGKAFVPFAYSENGSIAAAADVIAAACADSVLAEPYVLSSDSEIAAGTAFDSWLKTAVYGN